MACVSLLLRVTCVVCSKYGPLIGVLKLHNLHNDGIRTPSARAHAGGPRRRPICATIGLWACEP